MSTVSKVAPTLDTLHTLWNAQRHLLAHRPYPREPSKGDAEAMRILSNAENQVRDILRGRTQP